MMTRDQFMLWLGVVVGDDVSAMRRACDKGRQRLEQQGWRPQSQLARDAERHRGRVAALDAIAEAEEREDAPPHAAPA